MPWGSGKKREIFALMKTASGCCGGQEKKGISVADVYKRHEQTSKEGVGGRNLIRRFLGGRSGTDLGGKEKTASRAGLNQKNLRRDRDAYRKALRERDKKMTGNQILLELIAVEVYVQTCKIVLGGSSKSSARSSLASGRTYLNLK